MQIKFFDINQDFLEDLNLWISGQEDFDNYLQNKAKEYLYNKQSFCQLGIADFDEKITDLKSDIENKYSFLAKSLYPKFTKLVSFLTKKENNTTTTNRGTELQTTTFFEPIQNETQKEISDKGQINQFEPTTTTTIFERNENDPKIIEFFDLTYKEIEKAFAPLLNWILCEAVEW